MKDIGLTHSDSELIINALGRINIISEHTDYKKGYVLPIAIDKKIRCLHRKNGKEIS